MLCALVISPFGGLLFQNGTCANGHYVLISSDGQTQTEADPPLCRRLVKRDRVIYATLTLNVPTGGFPQIVLAFFSEDHAGWIPQHIPRSTWYAITWPLLALPFWWAAGRGIEAALGRVRKTPYLPLRGHEALLSFIPLLAGIGYVIISIHALLARSRDAWTIIFLASGAMWFALGSTTLIAGILQLREERAARLGRNQR